MSAWHKNFPKEHSIKKTGASAENLNNTLAEVIMFIETTNIENQKRQQ